jgi:hypothetical protein
LAGARRALRVLTNVTVLSGALSSASVTSGGAVLSDSLRVGSWLTVSSAAGGATQATVRANILDADAARVIGALGVGADASVNGSLLVRANATVAGRAVVQSGALIAGNVELTLAASDDAAATTVGGNVTVSRVRARAGEVPGRLVVRGQDAAVGSGGAGGDLELDAGAGGVVRVGAQSARVSVVGAPVFLASGSSLSVSGPVTAAVSLDVPAATLSSGLTVANALSVSSAVGGVLQGGLSVRGSYGHLGAADSSDLFELRRAGSVGGATGVGGSLAVRAADGPVSGGSLVLDAGASGNASANGTVYVGAQRASAVVIGRDDASASAANTTVSLRAAAITLGGGNVRVERDVVVASAGAVVAGGAGVTVAAATGGVTASGVLSVGAGLRSSGALTVGGGELLVTDASISVRNGSLSVSGPLSVGAANVVLTQAAGAVTVARSVAPAASASGASMFVLGQGADAAGSAGSTVGGDVVLDAGAGNLRGGVVYVGRTSASSVVLGRAAGTVTVAASATLAQGVSVAGAAQMSGGLQVLGTMGVAVGSGGLTTSGPLSAASLNATGFVRAASVTSDALTATQFTASAASIRDTLLLGTGDKRFTIARPVASVDVGDARATYVLGQDASSASSRGGDIFVDAGAGTSSENGAVRIGANVASAVVLGSSLTVSQNAAGTSMTVAVRSLTSSGTVTARGVSSSADVTATGLSVTGSVAVANGISMGGSLQATSVVASSSLSTVTLTTTQLQTTTLQASTLSVTGTLGVGGDVTLGRDARVAGDAFVTGRVSVGQALTVTGSSQLLSTLSVASAATFQSSVLATSLSVPTEAAISLARISTAFLNGASVTAALTAQTVTAAVAHVGNLTASGVAWLQGVVTVTGPSVALGSGSSAEAFTIARLPRDGGAATATTTLLLGQSASAPSGTFGGDVQIDAGTGPSGGGQLRLGLAARRIVIGSNSSTTSEVLLPTLLSVTRVTADNVSIAALTVSAARAAQLTVDSATAGEATVLGALTVGTNARVGGSLTVAGSAAVAAGTVRLGEPASAATALTLGAAQLTNDTLSGRTLHVLGQSVASSAAAGTQGGDLVLQAGRGGAAGSLDGVVRIGRAGVPSALLVIDSPTTLARSAQLNGSLTVTDAVSVYGAASVNSTLAVAQQVTAGSLVVLGDARTAQLLNASRVLVGTLTASGDVRAEANVSIASMLTVAKSVSAASAQLSGQLDARSARLESLVVTDGSALEGAVTLGRNASTQAFVMARAAAASDAGVNGTSTSLVGQAAPQGAGGDLVLEPGTGAIADGRVRLGARASAVEIGRAGAPITLAGVVRAASLSSSGAVTVSSTLAVGDNVTLARTLTVSGNARLASRLTVSGDVDVQSTARVGALQIQALAVALGGADVTVSVFNASNGGSGGVQRLLLAGQSVDAGAAAAGATGAAGDVLVDAGAYAGNRSRDGVLRLGTLAASAVIVGRATDGVSEPYVPVRVMGSLSTLGPATAASLSVAGVTLGAGAVTAAAQLSAPVLLAESVTATTLATRGSVAVNGSLSVAGNATVAGYELRFQAPATASDGSGSVPSTVVVGIASGSSSAAVGSSGASLLVHAQDMSAAVSGSVGGGVSLQGGSGAASGGSVTIAAGTNSAGNRAQVHLLGNTSVAGTLSASGDASLAGALTVGTRVAVPFVVASAANLTSVTVAQLTATGAVSAVAASVGDLRGDALSVATSASVGRNVWLGSATEASPAGVTVAPQVRTSDLGAASPAAALVVSGQDVAPSVATPAAATGGDLVLRAGRGVGGVAGVVRVAPLSGAPDAPATTVVIGGLANDTAAGNGAGGAGATPARVVVRGQLDAVAMNVSGSVTAGALSVSSVLSASSAMVASGVTSGSLLAGSVSAQTVVRAPLASVQGLSVAGTAGVSGAMAVASELVVGGPLLQLNQSVAGSTFTVMMRAGSASDPLPSAGRTLYVLGQSAQVTGGDVVVAAGSAGTTHGRVLIGTTASTSQIVLGAPLSSSRALTASSVSSGSAVQAVSVTATESIGAPVLTASVSLVAGAVTASSLRVSDVTVSTSIQAQGADLTVFNVRSLGSVSAAEGLRTPLGITAESARITATVNVGAVTTSGAITAVDVTVSNLLATNKLVVAGSVTVSTLSTTSNVLSENLSASGRVTATQGLETSSLTATGSGVLQGNLLAGLTSATFSLSRPASTLASGRSTFVLGQSVTNGVLSGGDLVLDAGASPTAAQSGVVLVGTGSARSVDIGRAGAASSVRVLASETLVNGTLSVLSSVSAGSLSAQQLTAGSAAVSASLVVGGALNVTQELRAASLSLSGGLTASGDGVQLGTAAAGAAVTVGRVPVAAGASGAAGGTFVLGQRNMGTGAGGDMTLDVGTSATPATVANGVLHLGPSASRSVIGSGLTGASISMRDPMRGVSLSVGGGTLAALAALNISATNSTDMASASSLYAPTVFISDQLLINGSLTARGSEVVVNNMRVNGSFSVANLELNSLATPYVKADGLTIGPQQAQFDGFLRGTAGQFSGQLVVASLSVQTTAYVGATLTAANNLHLGSSNLSQPVTVGMLPQQVATNRPAHTLYVLGQDGYFDGRGGDLVLNAGHSEFGVNGSVVIGQHSAGVVIGGAARTTSLLGSLSVANNVQVDNTLNAQFVNTSVLRTSVLQVQAGVQALGLTVDVLEVRQSVKLLDDDIFIGSGLSTAAITIAPTPLPGGAGGVAGHTVYLLGQSGLLTGGDMSLDVGTGATGNGTVYLGRRHATRVEIGATGGSVTTGGTLSVAQSVRAGGAVTASALSVSGAVQAGTSLSSVNATLSGAIVAPRGEFGSASLSTMAVSGSVTVGGVLSTGSDAVVGGARLLVGSTLSSAGAVPPAPAVTVAAHPVAFGPASMNVLAQNTTSGGVGGTLVLDAGVGVAGNGAVRIGDRATALSVMSPAQFAQSVVVGGALTVNGGLNLARLDVVNVSVSSSATVSGPLSVGGDVTAGSALRVVQGASIGGSVTVSGALLSTAGVLQSAGLSAGTARLVVGGSALQSGAGAASFTLALPTRTAEGTGTPGTFAVLAQSSVAPELFAGGDLLLDAGTGSAGASAGVVLVGTSFARGIRVGAPSTTLTVLGPATMTNVTVQALTAASMSASVQLRASALLAGSAVATSLQVTTLTAESAVLTSVSAAAVTVSGTLSTQASVSVGTNLVLGAAATAASAPVTVTRPVAGSGSAGRSIFVLGQTGASGQAGGDLLLNGGETGGTGAVKNGSVLVGTSTTRRVVLGSDELVVSAASATFTTPMLGVVSLSASGSAQVASSLSVGGSSLLVGAVELGDAVGASPFTVGRTVRTSGAGRTTFFAGQGAAAGAGGDVAINGGRSLSGAAHGKVVLGAQFTSLIDVGSASTPVLVRGGVELQGNVTTTAHITSASIAVAQLTVGKILIDQSFDLSGDVSTGGTLRGQSLSVGANGVIGGALTVNSLRVQSGGAVLGGTGVVLGEEPSALTMSRPTRTTGSAGRTTALLGQSAPLTGGDVVVDAGTGATSGGAVQIGTASAGSVRVGSATAAVTVTSQLPVVLVGGGLSVTDSGAVLLGARGLSSSGALTASTLVAGGSGQNMTLNAAGSGAVLIGTQSGTSNVYLGRSGQLVSVRSALAVDAGAQFFGDVSVAGALRANTLTASGVVAAEHVSASGTVTAQTRLQVGGSSLFLGAVSVSNTLAVQTEASMATLLVSGTGQVTGARLLLGGTGASTAFTFERPQALLHGTTLFVSGQQGSTSENGNGGDVVINGGLGNNNGIVRVAPASGRVQLGKADTSAAFLGSLSVAQSLTATGLLNVSLAYVSGAVTASGLTLGSGITASNALAGSAVLSSSLSVGGPVTAATRVQLQTLSPTDTFVIERTAVSGGDTTGSTTSLLGQSAVVASGVGGDVVVDAGAGAGSLPANGGRVLVGTTRASQVVLGSAGAGVSVASGLTVGGAGSFGGALTAGSLLERRQRRRWRLG